MQHIEVIERRLTREQSARSQAELLLEEKSRAVYDANSELKALTECLREQGERTHAIVANAAEGIITISNAGYIDSVNPAAERMFAMAADEMVGKRADSLFANPCRETSPDATICTPQWLISSKREADREILGRRSDGTEFPMELIISEVTINNRHAYMSLVRDLTRRKQLEAQLAHAQRMESVGQLAAGIAHEINTPIQYVGDNTRFLNNAFHDLEDYFESVDQLIQACEDNNLCSSLVKRTKALMEESDLEYLREEIPLAIQHSLDGAERVATIVRAMKEFSHPGIREKAAIDLNHAIQSTVTVSRNEWKYVSEVEMQFANDLPLVPCYAGDLNQALLNMIVNAAHAIESTRDDETQPLGTITISTKQVDNWAEIRISDTGSGIPLDAQSKIFDPFFTTKAVGKGTGQGLAITYSVIVEKHGGTISFETEQNAGTTFIVRLPIE
ncbi:two-component system sensor histidine kinase NtrB [Aeoliella mucimassa]|uniref:histidine kinase n=1 Tax=Aeoliella mucimassa TaxID=2527972 RepID=A0A518AHG1_9BACT|nr:ATP-binding protein [Aeoliella mucimassa]QDU54166.1 Sensor protein FixL [Aeoliella mucimassa]